MKKIYAALFCLVGAMTSSYANPGDTTIVQAQNLTQLPNYGNYDTPVTFPNGSVTYRKVIMEFTLGKYACPGYNPNDPGETSQGHTGWCADWDYDVHLMAMIPGGDTMELARMITPYANSNFPRTPAAWSHPYVFDVTDYYPMLKNDATMRIFFSGYSGGFTGSIKFYFIEGTPPRNVIKIDNLWQGDYRYGDATASIDTKITAKTLSMPSTAQSAEMKVIVTGHGSDNTGCAEFCKKYYQVKVNGTMSEQKDIWRDDCGSTFLYPQSGTWVYDRGNWCPGDLVHTNIHKIPTTVTPGSSFTADLDFQTYSSTNDQTRYKVAAGMFYYGAFNHTVDAGLEAIISPSLLEANYRSNPVCGQPVVNVKNFGSTTLTSIKFSYGVVGQTMSTYTWTGSMSSLNDADITLPSIPEMNTVSGTNNKFVVTIVEANGATDGDNFNNTLNSSFEAAPKWDGGKFRVDLTTSSNVQGAVNKINWTVKDMSGNVMYSRLSSAAKTQYLDTLNLPNGCYRLDVDGSAVGWGTRFFNYIATPGYFRMYNMNNGAAIPLPKTDLGSSGLEGNFGNGFTQYFTVQNSSVTSIKNISNATFSLSVYPNPAKDYINVDILGYLTETSNIQLINLVGQVVYANNSKDLKVKINTTNLASGVYTLIYTSGDSKKVEKVVISK